MTEQTNTPGLRFPGFSENWEIIKVRDLSKETIGGGTPNTSKSNYWKGELNWIQSSDLSLDNLFKHRSKKYINDKALNNSSAKKISANSIAIVSRVGVGKLVYINHEYATSQDFINLVHLNYPFKFIMYSLYLLLKGEANKLQGTSIKGITKKDLLNYSLNIPKTIEEQEKIGVFFNKLDRQIELEEEKLELLEQQKRGYMQKIFTQELKFKNSQLENIKWSYKTLEELNSFFTDGNYGESYPKSEDMSDKNDGVAFLRGSNLKKGRITLEDANYISKKKHSELTTGHLFLDDIVIAVRGSLGAVGYVNENMVGNNINSQLAIIRTSNSLLYGKYLLYYLMSNQGKKELLSRVTGTALKQLPIKQIKQIKVPVPKLYEQHKIANFLSELDNLIDNQTEKIELLKERKKGFLQKMFV